MPMELDEFLKKYGNRSEQSDQQQKNNGVPSFEEFVGKYGRNRPKETVNRPVNQTVSFDDYLKGLSASARQATDAYEQYKNKMTPAPRYDDMYAGYAVDPVSAQNMRTNPTSKRDEDELARLYGEVKKAQDAEKEASLFKQYSDNLKKFGGSSDDMFADYEARLKELKQQYISSPGTWRQTSKQVKALEQERDTLKDYESSLKKSEENAALIEAWTKGHGGTYESYQQAQARYDQLDQRVTQLQNKLLTTGDNTDYSGYAVDDMSSAAILNAPEQKSSQNLQTELEQAIREREQARTVLQYARAHQTDDLQKSPDFDTKASEGEQKFQQFKQEQQEELQNIQANPYTDPFADFTEYYNPRYFSEFREPDERWTEEEKKNFYYLFADEDTREQAYAYGTRVDDKYNLGEAENEDLKTQEYFTRNFGTGLAGSALSVPASLVGGTIDYARMFGETMQRGEAYETRYKGLSRWAETGRGAISQKLNESGTISKDIPVLGGKGLGDLYQLMMSMADSSVAVVAGGGPANAVFFGSAAASATRDALDRGLSGGKAVALGFASGAAEVLGETLSIENLLSQGDIADYLRNGLLKNMLKQGGVEASEEVLTTVLNTLADAVINGDMSEMQQGIYAKVVSGMSYDDAVRAASKEWIEGLGADALGGFLSGGLMSGGRAVLKSGIAAATTYKGDAKGLIQMAGATEEGSKARKLADRYQKTLDKKGNISNLQKAKLEANIAADINEADRPALVQAAEARLRDQSTTSRGSAEYTRMAENIVDKMLSGERTEFPSALEQNVYEEMVTQLRGEKVPTGDWMDTSGLKITQARQMAEQRMKSVEVKETGERATIQAASMTDGKLTFRIDVNGTEKTVGMDELKLDDYQKDALETLTKLLGKDAAAAFNSMRGDQMVYGTAFGIKSYAFKFGTIRDLFGRGATDIKKAEEAALVSSFRKGLSDAQVINAVQLGYQKSQKEDVPEAKYHKGSGNVTLGGGTITNNGKTITLQAVKDQNRVLRSEQYRAVKAVAEALGKDVVLFESRSDEEGNLEGIQGAYQNGVIYLDWNAGMKTAKDIGSRMLLKTMSHELTHAIQESSPEDYKQLKDFVTRYLAEKMGDKFHDYVMSKTQGREDANYDAIMDEVVADSCELMLKDSNAVKQLMIENRPLWDRIRSWILDFLRRIKGEDEGARILQGAKDELTRLWDLGLTHMVQGQNASVGEMKAEVLESSSEALTEIDPTSETAAVTMPDGSQYSIRSMRHDIAEGKMFEDLERFTDMSHEEVVNLRKGLERLTDIIALNRDILDLNETFGKDNRPFKPYKPNSDPLYTISLDFSTLCRKRLMTQYVIERLQTELTDSQTGKRGRPLTAEEQLAVRDLMKEYAKQEKALKVACAMCYVEAARLKAPGQIQRFMRDPTEPMRRYFALRNSEFNASVRQAQADFKEQHGYARDTKKADMKPSDVKALNKLSDKLRSEYQLSAEEQTELDIAKTLPNETYLTAANLARLAEEHPVIYDAYTATIRSATRSKSLEADIPYYYGDSNRVVSDDFIAAVNRENGMRFSSWSDFQIQHMLDMMTAVIELSTRHCAMHGYTKFLEQVRIFGRTGMMFNMSGVANGTGLKADGSLDFSPTESVLVFGQDGEYDAIRARDEFPETAGLQCIGISTEHIQALLDSDIIDYIIPYHTSGLNATLRRMAQISNWKDFTAFQNAKQDPSIRFDPSIHDRETWHKEPVFSEFFNAAKQESNGYRAGEKGIVTMRRAAELYKQMCRERGMMPKFSWGNSKVDADFSNDPNYWKLLIDRKMINQKTGALIEQKPVRPDFDFKLIEQMVQEAVDAYDPTLQDRALNYVREHLDELPQRIADLKKAGAVKKITSSKTNKAAKTLQAGPVAAVSEANAVAQLSAREVQDAVEESHGSEGQPMEKGVQFSRRVTDPQTLKFLNDQLESGEVIHTYKTFLEVKENGKTLLLPPMAAKQRGDDGKLHWANAMALNEWEESVGNPNSKGIISKVNNKGETKWYYRLVKDNGKTVDAAYDPYQHSSDVVLNDQFEEAYQRPNLVTYECVIPKSELTSGYHYRQARSDGQIVEAALPVGKHPWKKGTVAGKLKNTDRGVYLTRWLMPVRRVSDAEVAQEYKKILDKEDSPVEIPFNVVPPGLLTELEKAGVPIDYDGSPGYRYRASKKAATTGGGTAQFSLRDLNIDRKYIKHGDVYAEDAAVRDTVNSLIAREKFVNISARDAAEFNGIDYSDYKVARNAFSKILERFLGETIRLTHGGQMAEVYLTRRGLNHAAVTEYTPGKAAVYKKLRKMITNAEYSYSSVDDPHAETRPKGEAYWDAFVSVARFGKYIFPTVIKFRSLDRDIRSQIYNIASKREEIGSSHSPGLNNQGGLPNYGVTPISDGSIEQGAEEVKGQFSVRSDAKTDRELLDDFYQRMLKKGEAEVQQTSSAYQQMLKDKQGVINELQKEQREALEKFHKLSEDYRAREKEVFDGLQELDKLVQEGTDPAAISRQRQKLTAAEERMTTALKRLSQLQERPTLQKILQQEREIQRTRIRETIREGVNRKALRGKIDKLWKDLNRRITSPTEKKHIPAEVMQQAIEVLEALNMDTSREGSKAGETLRSRLAALQNRYGELKDDPDFNKAAVYDAQVAEFLARMIEEVGDTPINRMSASQMERVYETLKALDFTARRALKLKLGEEERTAYDVSMSMTKETRSVAKPQRRLLDAWINAQLSPERMFNRLGGYHKDSTWSQVYRMLNDGQLRQTQLQMEGSLIFDGLLNDKQYEKFVDPKNTVDIGLKDENGNAVEITHGMMVSLWMHLQNEQNRRHVAYGGLTIPGLKEYYNGKKTRGSERATRIGGVLQELAEINDKLREAEDENEIAELEAQRDEISVKALDFLENLQSAIEEKMTDYDRAWVTACREMFDGFSKRVLNETTMEVYGIKRANVENYFPIWVDGDFLNTPFETVAKDMSLENAGFMKERVNSAKPIRLADVSDVAASQIRKVAQYAGLMPAIRDFNKIWGKTQTGYRDSLQKAVRETYGDSGLKYIENLMADLNGARGQSNGVLGEFFNRMRGHMAQASLTLSLRTALGQTASYPTAAAVVGWDALHKAFWHGGRKGQMISRADQELIRKWSPLLYYRMKGYANTELGDIAGMNDKWSRLWKKARWATGWIQAMDGATVGRLWYAAEYYVQDHNKAPAKGSDAYYEEVAKVFNDIVEKTQPNYSTMQRPDILRNPNALVKQLTMFLTQRLQNFNILYDAAATFSTMKADYKAGRNGVTAEDVKEAARQTRTAAISQIAAAATITAFKFLADVILHSLNNYRDDDDKELKAESISLELLDMFLDSLAGNVLGGSEVWDIVESKAFNKTYYGIEVSGVSTVTDLVETANSVFSKVANGEASLSDLDRLAKKIGPVVGIPYGNAMKIVNAGRYWVQDAVNGEWMEAGVDRTTVQQARRLYQAYAEKDYGKVNKVLGEVPEDKQKSLYETVRKLIKQEYKDGEITVYEAIRRMQQYGQASDQTMQNFIKDAFADGAITQKEAENQLVKFGGKTEKQAEKTMTSAAAKQSTGIDYNDIDDMYQLGKLSRADAKKTMLEYGLDEEKADMNLAYWDYRKQRPDTTMTKDRFETYYKNYRPVGMTPGMYEDFKTEWNAVQGTDKNHDGKADSGSKKTERVALIDSLPLTKDQKDQLFLMEWAASGLGETPWHK